jgi:hypothetical protein
MGTGPLVMPANAGIHDFSLLQQGKRRIAAFAGMPRAHRRRVDQSDT